MQDEPTVMYFNWETGEVRTNVKLKPKVLEPPTQRRGYLPKEGAICDDARKNPAFEEVVKMDGRTILVDKFTGRLMEGLMALNFIKD